MTEENPKSRFKVGDIVQVVDEPYEDCPFEWIDEMDECCGKTATIKSVRWDNYYGQYAYGIDIDEYHCSWCERCFIEDSEIEESDSEIKMLFQ